MHYPRKDLCSDSSRSWILNSLWTLEHLCAKYYFLNASRRQVMEGVRTGRSTILTLCGWFWLENDPKSFLNCIFLYFLVFPRLECVFDPFQIKLPSFYGLGG